MAEIIEQSSINGHEIVPPLLENGTQDEYHQKTLKQLPENATQNSKNGPNMTSSSSENLAQNGEKEPDTSSSVSENVEQNGDDKLDASSQISENVAQNCKNEADASSPLSQAEVDAITGSFRVLWKEKKENGTEIFIKMLTLYPTAQDVFEDFRGLTLEQVRGHKKLRAHVLSVMYAIKSYVDNLNDLVTLDQLVRKTARNHKPRGVDAEKMSWLLQPLLETVEDKMGKDVTDLHRTGWEKVFHVLCALTKDEQEDVENETDASSPLSKEEVEAIEHSFTVLWKDKKENGIELFIKLFTLHPKTQDAFEDFRDLTLEQVRGHKKLRAHVLSVMYSIKSYVDNLNDFETLEQLVRKTARNHKPRGVDAEKMGWILQPFLELVEDKMGKGVTDVYRTGWKKVFHVMCTLTKDEQEVAENEADASSPLSKEEIEAITDSFKVLWEEKKENGIELFIKFFTLQPKAQDVFEDFRGLTLEQVRGHKKLRAHALSVLYAVKSYVDNLNDLETLEQLVRKTARNHKPRGVGEDKMAWILQPLLELVEDKMGKDVTDLHRTGWKKVFDVMCALTKDEQEDTE